MSAYNPQDTYVLDPDFRLRNDGCKTTVGYYGLAGDGEIGFLAPLDAVVATAFDGVRTAAEVEDICSVLFRGVPEEKARPNARVLVRRVVESHLVPKSPFPVPLLRHRQELDLEAFARTRGYLPTQFVPYPRKDGCLVDRLPFPSSILWLVTNQCPVKCQYCYMHRTPVPQAEMLPWDRSREILHEAGEGGVMSIGISGGDPMRYNRIFDLLDLLAELGFEPVDLPTKSYVSAETARRLARCRNVRAFQCSLDSTVPEIADFMVQTPGFCEWTLKSLRNCVDAGLNVNIKAVITPYNLPTIPKLYRDVRAMGVKVILATYCRSGFWHKDKSVQPC